MSERKSPPRVLVLGGAHIDRRGRIAGPTVTGASNPGHFFIEPGGGGFNAARNLGLLGLAVRMISPRGGDSDGETVADAAAACGIEDRPFVFLDRRTPSYTAILSAEGDLVIALADMELYTLFTPRRLRVRAVREAISAADLVLCDANLPSDTLAALARAAKGEGKPLAAIAISPAKAIRLLGSLDLFDHVFMNEAEARALCGAEPDRPEDWPALLRKAGLGGGAVTRGSQPAIVFNGESAFTVAPPPVEKVADVTGAGDAFAAGTLAGLLNGCALDAAARHGAALAALTVASQKAVATDIDQNLFETMVGLAVSRPLLA